MNGLAMGETTQVGASEPDVGWRRVIEAGLAGRRHGYRRVGTGSLCTICGLAGKESVPSQEFGWTRGGLAGTGEVNELARNNAAQVAVSGLGMAGLRCT